VKEGVRREQKQKQKDEKTQTRKEKHCTMATRTSLHDVGGATKTTWQQIAPEL
tara:strand:- start:982 stop:1140 length:159 start_codon:yes stop_codon:yes gene_type:complete